MSDDDIRKRILDDLDFATDRLSTQTRQVAFGVLALFWALVVGETPEHVAVPRRGLLAIAVLALGALLADFLQYLSAYVASQQARRSLAPGAAAPYDTRWISYRLRVCFFFIKIGLVVLAASALIALLMKALI
ncbi:MAG: hypothetical protein U0X73_17520 [Thermoanaerobaculia bacterium]